MTALYSRDFVRSLQGRHGPPPIDATADVGTTYSQLDSYVHDEKVFIGQRSPLGCKFRRRYRLIVRAALVLPAIAVVLMGALLVRERVENARLTNELAAAKKAAAAAPGPDPFARCRVLAGITYCVRKHRGI